MKEGIFMKKLLVPVILMMAWLAGCGNAGNDSLVNKEYTIEINKICMDSARLSIEDAIEDLSKVFE